MEAKTIRVACFTSRSYEIQHFISSMEALPKDQHVEIKYFTETLNAQIAEKLLPKDYFTAVCVFVNDNVKIECLEKLKEKGIILVALRCAGFNNVDLKKAKELGIKVVRVPAYSPQAVAEHALALIMTYNRKLHKAYNRMREYNFNLEGLMGFDLFKKTIGIVGCGRIGAALMCIAKGLGMRILAYDVIKPTYDLKGIYGADFVDLDTIYKECDVISLHVPLTNETQHMINKDSLAKMKKNVILCNTSRGNIVKTADIIPFLRDNKIGGYVADVYENEGGVYFNDRSNDPPRDPELAELLMLNNVLLSPHQGALTSDAWKEITTITIQNINDIHKEGKCKNEIDP